MFLNANIDIPLTVPIGANDMKTAHQYLPAVLFLILSIFSLTPTITRADQQSQPGTVIIDASGEATAISSGPSGAASLKLTGEAYNNSNGWLTIQNITGVLQIGSTDFTISGGQGSVSKAGAIAIFADTTTGKGQLILHGFMSGNSVTFGTPSQLVSTSYLTLSGNIKNNAKQAAAPTSSITTESTNSVENLTTSTSSLKMTQHTNSTSILQTSTLQNTTTQSTHTSSTTIANVTVEVTNTTAIFAATSSSVIENVTTSNNNETGRHSVTIHVVQGQGEICLSSRDQMPVCTTASQTVSVKDGELVNFDATPDNGFTWDHYDGLGIGQAQNFNAVITQDNATGVYFTPMSTANATAAISLPTDTNTTISSSDDSTIGTAIATNTMPMPSNGTVTMTQYVSQTVFVTQTLANSTISYAVTSTVAKTTITRGNTTLVVNATTTVSTTTEP